MRIPGSWTIARPFGVPVRIHWSVPVCALLAGGLAVAPGAWLAYVLLVLIHEAGHAFVVRRVGARAIALDVLGFGGLCWWEGNVTPLQRACIAWGGIWAQLVVLAVTAIAVFFLGRPSHSFAAQMIDVALVSNLWLIGINLLPIPPLDGKEAWSLFPLLRRRFTRARATSVAHHLSPDDRSPGHRAVARIRVLSPRLDPREIERPSRHDVEDLDEASFTPEVEAVIERARTIARDAARAPKQAGDVHDEGKGDGSA